MNRWFRDPRVEQAQLDGLHAEQSERRGEIEKARALYRAAACGYEAVALSVSADHPNTRTDLGIAGVACFARSGCFDLAVRLAHRLLAERGALTNYGCEELARLAADYSLLLPRPAVSIGSSRSLECRANIRDRFRRPAA